MDIESLQQQLSKFADERDWDQFHNPKNLAIALSVEASELIEIFQWLTPEQSEEIMRGDKANHVKEEVADILIYLLRFADKLNIDLDAAVRSKIEKNAQKYPVTPEEFLDIPMSKRDVDQSSIEGGDLDQIDEEELDIPAFIRQNRQ